MEQSNRRTARKEFQAKIALTGALWACACALCLFVFSRSGASNRLAVIILAVLGTGIFLALTIIMARVSTAYTEAEKWCEKLTANLGTAIEETLETRVDVEDINLKLEKELSRVQSMVYKAESSDFIKTALLNSISSILIGVDNDGVVVEWNRVTTDFFGITRVDATGLFFSDISLPWDWERIRPTWDECLTKSDHAIAKDVHYTDRDGKDGYLEVTVSPFFSDNGEIAGRLILAVIVTERMRLEDELRQSEKMRSVGQLAAGIAHEINTPTQYIGDNSQFLEEAFSEIMPLLKKYDAMRESYKNGDPLSEHLADIETLISDIDLGFLYDEIPMASKQCLEGVGRVTEIVKGMKDFAHPDSGVKSEADLNKLIGSTAVVTRNEWKYVADLETDYDPDLPLVPCLAAELNQVILNLIINASHAVADVVESNSGTKGCITVSTRHVDDWAEIRISDTGTGIPEEFQPRIFEPFFTTKGVGKGTGQGLSISYAIITEKHNGTIDFETGKDKGTTFIIRLPLEAVPVNVE